MYPPKYGISLRIWHPTRSAAEIQKRLRLQPSFTQSAGAGRETPKGTKLSGRHERTYCCFERTHPAGVPPAKFLSRDVRKLAAHRRYFAALVRSGGRIEYYVTLSGTGAAGETFDAELLRALAAMRIDLSIETFSHPQRAHR